MMSTLIKVYELPPAFLRNVCRYNAVALDRGIGLLTDVSGLLNDNVVDTWDLSKNKRSFIALWISPGEMPFEKCPVKVMLTMTGVYAWGGGEIDFNIAASQ